ncbi:oxygenase MpaB family protein [Psychrobacter lutiphocae]|uniref:oxygenase MpaB family protein n=1 Tax=Psychrobacter lutiphocae TaxID=540500 RepID=UPI0003A05754|nr:oxygenase MpaB family protein [Psychrobacter lutiphocae]
MRKYVLPKGYKLKKEILDDIAESYEMTDPVVDALTSKYKRFADDLQNAILNKAVFTASDKAHMLADPNFKKMVDKFSGHPDWFDVKLAEKEAIAYRRYPLTLVWLLRNVALMAGYSIPALSLPLVKTGSLVHDALARLYRTYGYMMAVSEHPAVCGDETPLAVGGEAWRQTIIIRQMHSFHLQFSLLISRGLK